MDRAGPIGKVQISLDFTAGQRSIVIFRQVQATQGCEAASMPRGGCESVRHIRALRSEIVTSVGIQSFRFRRKNYFQRSRSNECVWNFFHFQTE
jgi:hypothetical protein